MTLWAASELHSIDFKDVRLSKRLFRLVDDLAAHPTASIPQACGSWTARKGAYRFLDSKRVTPKAIRSAHQERTLARVGFQTSVLVIQDTTELDFTCHPATTDLGYLDHPKHRGLKVHSALAATTDGLPLGLIHQAVWTRDPATLGKKHQRAVRDAAEKESQRWLTALSATQDAIPDDIQVITVADREADFYPLFAAERRTGTELLIRAAHNRRVDTHTRLLEEAIAAAPIGGLLTISVPRRDDQPARQATLALRWTSVTFGPPQNAKQRATLPHIAVQVVVAEEVAPPPGVKPLRWVLLTTLVVAGWEDAVQIVRWYRTRWLIERYHFVLKSGCGIEKLQLETAERLQRALAVYCVVAWRLLWLTYQARQEPDEVCTVVLAPHEWQALYCTIHQTPIPPATPPTLRQAVRWIAQLGGFLARTGDGEPGVQTIWRGLRRLEDIAATWLLLHCVPPDQLDNVSYG
jgi:Transposase DNA-binding/Transposase Tn5 dimerisation domain